MTGIPSWSRTVLVFTIELAVFDEDGLARAAKARAREDGLNDEVWASMRSGMSDDLIMLLDPGLVADAGFEIIQSRGRSAPAVDLLVRLFPRPRTHIQHAPAFSA